MNSGPIRRSKAAFLVVGAVHSSAQSQYAFVLPWILITRGAPSAGVVLSAALGYLPYLVLAPVAASLGDRTRPRRLVLAAILTAAVAAAAYPVSGVFGQPSFVLVYLAAVAFGAGRPFVDAGVFCAIAALERRDVLQLQSARSILSQAAAFGGPAIGFAVMHLDGADGVCWAICGLLLVGAACVLLTPQAAPTPTSERTVASTRSALVSAYRSPRLRRVIGSLVGWNLVAGAAFSLVPLLFARQKLSSGSAALTFLAGSSAVVCLAYPLMTLSLSRVRVGVVFAGAVAFEGAAFFAFSSAEAPWLFLLYAGFLVWNSVAASAGNSARALVSRPDEQALMGVATTAATTLAYLVGVLGAALALVDLPVSTVAAVVALLLVVLGAGVRFAQGGPIATPLRG